MTFNTRQFFVCHLVSRCWLITSLQLPLKLCSFMLNRNIWQNRSKMMPCEKGLKLHSNGNILFFILVICIFFPGNFYISYPLSCCTDHKQIELDCPVCLKIETARNLFKMAEAVSFYTGNVCVFFQIVKRYSEYNIRPSSPIISKVRNNCWKYP